jgi:phosphatidylglycerophosphate synthase
MTDALHPLPHHRAQDVSPALDPPTEGERWTRAELARLRDLGWSPGAILSFLRRSQTRANRTRRRRRTLARQEATWTLAGAAAWVIAGPSLATGSRRRTRRRGLIWWGGCALMLDWHLGMLETPDGREVALGVADALTLIRAWLVPGVADCPRTTLLLIGAATDFADGAVARRTRCTRLGRDLEGLVDACFAVAALRGAVRAGGLSPLPAALEQVRLAAGVIYATTVYFAAGHAPDDAVRHGGRLAAPVRMAGAIAARSGHRRLADRLVICGAVVSVLAVLRHADIRVAVDWVSAR